MNPAVLRRILIWVAPLLIGFFMKRYEARHAKKQEAKALAKK